jgi:D-alanyl-D-alanine carboxypeptidase (penicillin-binding protein 5/6)
MLIPSGNNIARLLARWDAGTEETFVTKMNRAAAVLGMTRTTYTTASGVEPSHQEHRGRSAEAGQGGDEGRGVPLDRRAAQCLGPRRPRPAGQRQHTARPRLVLGVVLYQNADTTPDAGLYAALDDSQKLIIAVERLLTSGRAGQAVGDPSGRGSR